MSGWADLGNIMQGRLNTELMSKSAGKGMGGDEKASHKRAKYAQMEFRISKGCEKDNMWTRIKYFFKER